MTEKKELDPRREVDDGALGSSPTSPPALQLPPQKYGTPYHASRAVNGLYSCADSLRFARTQRKGIFKVMSMDAQLSDAKAYSESLDSQMSILTRAEEHMRKLKTTVRKKRAAVLARIHSDLVKLLDKEPDMIYRLSRASSTVTETLDPLSPPTSPARSGSTAALSATYPPLELLEIPTTPPRSTTTGVRPVPARPVKPTRLQRSARLPSASSQPPQASNGSTDIDLELMGSSSWTTSQGNGL